MEAATTKTQSRDGKTCLQTPHTLRLLKLIHEGTPKFAALAVDRLPTNENAIVLWDLLGRLQAILTSTEWKTRQAAARAIEKLGKLLEPDEFLNQDDDKLTVQYVLDNLSSIASQSPLYGSSRSRYDLDEGDVEGDDVTARILRQRELLEKRLGLDSIGDVLGTDQTKNILIVNEDFMHHTRKRTRKDNAADDAILLETRNPFTELLVRQSQYGDNSLMLLTSELMYRMFHPSWWMRHGALLGLISLTKVFSKFGSWTESVLSRALCVLALDRFGDFAGDTVAPVRETAAQLVATILHTASIDTRETTITNLLEMVSNSTAWEIQHGALSAMKFIFTLSRSSDSILTQLQANSMVNATIDRLNNRLNDDVVSAAACVILECNEMVWEAAGPLWLALKSTTRCSSAVVHLVSLLKRMATNDSNKFADVIGEDPDSRLLELLGSPFLSVRLSTLEVVGTLSSSKELVESVFEMHYDTEIPVDILQRAWQSLCSRCFSVSVWRILMDRYFAADSKENHDTFPQRSAAALSLMYKGSFSDLTRFYLLAMMQSSWILQFEKSMLLYGYLVEFESTGFADFLSMDANLPCMSLANIGVELSKAILLRDAMTREAVDTFFTDVGRADEIARSLRTNLTSLCHSIENRPTSVHIMRVRAGIACALVTKEMLPKVITPLLRALVTSFNNEKERQRRLHTEHCLCRFIQLSNKERTREKAVSKVVDMVCGIACQESNSTASKSQQRDSAVRVLRSLAYLFQDIPQLWRKLSLFLQPTITNDEKISSLLIVNAVAKGFTQSCVDSMILFAQAFVGPLVGLRPMSRVLSLVSTTLVALCEVQPEQILEIAIPKLIVCFEDKTERTEYCKLLHDLIEASEASIGPFIRTILPEIMALMRDRSCGRIANSIFARLVRCAPLVTKSQVSSEFCVIDHLVFGEPLPPCRLPRQVQRSLQISKISLRKYQLEGISWLKFQQQVNVSGALCDDMGLGKTLQALIGVALAHAESGGNQKSLVICPSTLVLHWEQEIYKYFPCRQVFQALPLVGSPSERATLLRNRLDSSNLIVMSYSVLRSHIDELNSAFKSCWCYCVLDEGHLLKNPKTATAKAARKIEARHKLILSGTPIQNRVQELWGVFDFLMPNFLGDFAYFEKTFGRPIARGNLDGASAAAIAKGIEALKILHQTVLPFILRREKAQVLPELPAMTETILKVTMSNIQRRFYDSFCQRSDLNSSLETFEKQLEEGSESPAMPHIFKSLLFLRLVCTHPSLVVGDEFVESNGELSHFSSSGKLLALFGLLQEAGIVDNEAFGADNDSSYLYCEDGVDTNGEDSFRRVVDPVTEATESFSPVSVYSVNDHKVSKILIFAQFTRTLDIIEKMILQSPFMRSRYVRLCGKTALDKRMSICTSFQEDDDVKVMILATHVGGLGLNLTAADKVIFVENDFNPQTDLQAIDRTRRIGQTRQVDVYKLVTQNSIEESILRMQSKKLQMAKAVVSTENSSIYSMGTDRLLDIFSGRMTNTNEKETDLDGMLETCVEDYRSLSASFFKMGMNK